MSHMHAPAEFFFLAMASLIASKRNAFRRRRTYAFGVVDDTAYSIDTHDAGVVSDGWRDGCDVAVLCNKATLSDILRGAFDPRAPRPEHLFVWGGDQAAWSDLESALGPGMSQVSLRAQKGELP